VVTTIILMLNGALEATAIVGQNWNARQTLGAVKLSKAICTGHSK
jgi:hypothetical protein